MRRRPDRERGFLIQPVTPLSSSSDEIVRDSQCFNEHDGNLTTMIRAFTTIGESNDPGPFPNILLLQHATCTDPSTPTVFTEQTPQNFHQPNLFFTEKLSGGI